MEIHFIKGKEWFSITGYFWIKKMDKLIQIQKVIEDLFKKKKAAMKKFCTWAGSD